MGSVVLALDLLRWYGLRNIVLEDDFGYELYAPLLKQIKHSGAGSAAIDASVSRNLLSSGATLGDSFTARALSDLGLTEGHTQCQPWLPRARLEARRALDFMWQASGSIGSSSRVLGACGALFWFACVGRSLRQRAAVDIATGGSGCGEWFWPSSVDAALGVDGRVARGGHSPVLRLLTEAFEHDSRDPSDLEDGTSAAVNVYTPFTPCISCLAAYWQFCRRFPGVSFSVAFDAWRTTSRWPQGR